MGHYLGRPQPPPWVKRGMVHVTTPPSPTACPICTRRRRHIRRPRTLRPAYELNWPIYDAYRENA